jgi:sugar/nucleoside kinase (ribokinase family)
METSFCLCKEANKRGIDIAFDINFRPTLLSAKEAENNLKKLAPYITTLIGNEEHLKMLLGIKSEFGEDDREKCLFDIIDQTHNMLSIPKIAVTVRRTLSANDAITYAASCTIKHTVTNDINFATVDEITKLMNCGASDVGR